MTVSYVAYTWSGHRVTGTLEVANLDAAYSELESDELIPYRLREVPASRSFVERFPTLFKPKLQDLVNFSDQLSSLLRSGVPLRRSLATLESESRAPGLRLALHKVIEGIESGKRFSEAIEEHDTVFPEFYIRLVRVGEASGGLVITLDRLAETLRRRKSVQDSVRGALVYPALSLVVALVAGTILITYSLPALIELLAEFGGQLPFATRLLQGSAEFLQQYVLFVLGGFAGVAITATLYFRTAHGNRVWDTVTLKAPVIGGVITRSTMYNFTSTLKTLIDAGVPLVEGLRLAGEAVGNIVVREALDAAATEARSGTSLGQSFRQQTVFPLLLTQGIVTGELSGTLPKTLEGLSSYYSQESERAVGAATQLIQPAIILVVAVFVGFIAVAVLSGIYSTLGSVAG